MNDYIPHEFSNQATPLLAGKLVLKVQDVDDGMDDFLEIHFVDGSILRFRYDYIYEWEGDQCFT